MQIFRHFPHHLASYVVLSLVFTMPLLAKADIYMQQNIDNEIIITNLLPDAELSYLASEDEPDGSKRYLVLAEDNFMINKEKFSAKNSGNSTNQIIAEAVISAARLTSIEPALLHAVIRVESNYNPNALSPRGAQGLMQLMPSTAKRFNVHNAYDPKQNVLAGARYLRELQTLFKGNLQLVLAAYNAGPNAVTKYGFNIPPYLETRLYVPKVLSFYQQLR
jgi:soluble lytic murein transglycosylase-like protein